MKKILLALISILTFSNSVAFAQIVPADGDTRDVDATHKNGTITVLDDIVAGGDITGDSLIYPTASFETVAGAGTTVSDAAELSATAHVHRITGANGTVGWKFNSSLAIGSIEILLNTTAGVAKIYADAGGTVNGASADAAFSALTGIKPIICIKTAALTFLCA